MVTYAEIGSEITSDQGLIQSIFFLFIFKIDQEVEKVSIKKNYSKNSGNDMINIQNKNCHFVNNISTEIPSKGNKTHHRINSFKKHLNNAPQKKEENKSLNSEIIFEDSSYNDDWGSV